MTKVLGTDTESTSLDQDVDRLYNEEVLRVISIEMSKWRPDTDEKTAVEHALSPDFWLSFDADNRRPVVSDYDPLDRFPPPKPFDMNGVTKHNELCKWLREVRSRCFMHAVRDLIEQIANGKMFLTGQREPVQTEDQVRVNLPFGALQDRSWRLHRGRSYVQILNKNGAEVSAFRAVRICARQDATTESRPGRKPGSDFRTHDAVLHVQMRAMIEGGKARGPQDAAQAVARFAKGNRIKTGDPTIDGKIDKSRVKRLARGYKVRFPEQIVLSA